MTAACPFSISRAQPVSLRCAVERADRTLGDVTPQQLSARHAAAQQAIAALSDALDSAALDALIVIGDDQKEMLRGDRCRRC